MQSVPQLESVACSCCTFAPCSCCVLALSGKSPSCVVGIEAGAVLLDSLRATGQTNEQLELGGVLVAGLLLGLAALSNVSLQMATIGLCKAKAAQPAGVLLANLPSLSHGITHRASGLAQARIFKRRRLDLTAEPNGTQVRKQTLLQSAAKASPARQLPDLTALHTRGCKRLRHLQGGNQTHELAGGLRPRV